MCVCVSVCVCVIVCVIVCVDVCVSVSVDVIVCVDVSLFSELLNGHEMHWKRNHSHTGHLIRIVLTVSPRTDPYSTTTSRRRHVDDGVDVTSCGSSSTSRRRRRRRHVVVGARRSLFVGFVLTAVSYFINVRLVGWSSAVKLSDARAPHIYDNIPI